MVVRTTAAAANRPRAGGRHALADAAVIAILLVIIALVIQVANAVNAPISAAMRAGGISTDPIHLPEYAVRSLARMFMALAAATVFALVYAAAAARLRRTGRVLVLLLDILQSVPVLAFLSVTVSLWLVLFPGSMLGVEAAAVFAIFTGQAWNMAFAFYQSLLTQPRDLDEAVRLLRLSPLRRFWRFDVPGGMIPLVWNGMMSFGGGWFFLVASEAISVNNAHYVLPGIGSYVAAATADADAGRVLLALAVMVLLVVGVNILFWRPLTAWAEKFRTEHTAPAKIQRSSVLALLRRSRVPGLLRAGVRRMTPVRPVPRRPARSCPPGTGQCPARNRLPGTGPDPARTRPPSTGPSPARTRPPVPGSGIHSGRGRVDRALAAVTLGALLVGLGAILLFIHEETGLGEFAPAFLLGLVTLARVAVVLIVGTLVWVPLGVWIGMNPAITRIAQPIVQVLASFPANLLFPLVALALVQTGISLDLGGIVLMSLGAQWYILFNVIAGASAIPGDLREASRMLGLGRRSRWRNLIGPAIFPAWVTGAITAAGGAWNAAIVAEVVSYGTVTVTATGLGAYITQSTANGELARTLVGVLVMTALVIATNHLLWRRLYRLAASRFSLG